MGIWRRLGEGLGLIRAVDGTPSTGKPARLSRYGRFNSARLDEDIDELRARLADVEEQLRKANDR